MSKYDDINYQTYKERVHKELPHYQKEKNDVKDFPKEYKNQPIEKIKKLMKFKDPEEVKYFDFMNNNQDYVTNKYLDKARIFKDTFTDDEKLEYLLDFINEIYGVITPKVFKTKLEKMFYLENSNFKEEDYEKMIKNYFKNNFIDLENDDHRFKFKQIIFDDYIKASNVQNQNNIGNFVLPHAVENSIHISDNNIENDEEEERKIKEQAI